MQPTTANDLAENAVKNIINEIAKLKLLGDAEGAERVLQTDERMIYALQSISTELTSLNSTLGNIANTLRQMAIHQGVSGVY